MLVTVAFLAWTVIFVAVGQRAIAEAFLYLAVGALLVGEWMHLVEEWHELKPDLARAWRWFWRIPSG